LLKGLYSFLAPALTAEHESEVVERGLMVWVEFQRLACCCLGAGVVFVADLDESDGRVCGGDLGRQPD
jgi:hypothetical protein